MGGRLFGGADHGYQNVGLERRAWPLAQAVSGSVGSQGTATNVPALRVGTDRSWRPQERSADGEAACARRMRSIASLHCGRGLGRSACGNRTPCPSRQAGRRQRCRAGDRRYCDSQERHAFGWCRCAICVSAGQDRELPDPGIADAGARRSAGRTGVAVVSSRELDEQAVSVGASGCSGRMSNGTNETGNGSGGDRSCHRGGVRFGCVLADAGYGLSAPFRQGLTARKLAWAVGIPRHLKVYPADVRMIWPVAKRGRPRQRHLKAASDPAHRWRGERSGASSTAILRRDELCTRKTHFRSTVRPEPRLGPRAVQHIASRYCTRPQFWLPPPRFGYPCWRRRDSRYATVARIICGFQRWNFWFPTDWPPLAHRVLSSIFGDTPKSYLGVASRDHMVAPANVPSENHIRT